MNGCIRFCARQGHESKPYLYLGKVGAGKATGPCAMPRVGMGTCLQPHYDGELGALQGARRQQWGMGMQAAGPEHHPAPQYMSHSPSGPGLATQLSLATRTISMTEHTWDWPLWTPGPHRGLWGMVLCNDMATCIGWSWNKPMTQACPLAIMDYRCRWAS